MTLLRIQAALSRSKDQQAFVTRDRDLRWRWDKRSASN